MLDISVGAAFLAGLLSFVSPCVLPIVPPYLCYLAGVSVDELKGETATAATSRRIIFSSIAFVLGFATVFVALGATASVIGQTIAQYFDTLAIVAGAIIIVMGLHFLGVFRIALLFREARVQVQRKPAGLVGAYIIGLAFAFGWTPCIGPQLGAILSLAASEGSVARGTVLLAIYALGLGIPFLLVAPFLPRLTGLMGWMKRHMDRIERIMGLLLWTIGLLMLTGGFSAFSYWLLEHFPALATLG